MNQDELRLCYVKDSFAWFTSHFDDEWGDDWDDVPYEHNAGHPYGYHYTKLKDCVHHTLVKVAFEGPFDSPCANMTNSPYSVHTINGGVVPWLSVWPMRKGEFVRGGSTLKEFIDFVERNEGTVYTKRVTKNEALSE